MPCLFYVWMGFNLGTKNLDFSLRVIEYFIVGTKICALQYQCILFHTQFKSEGKFILEAKKKLRCI